MAKYSKKAQNKIGDVMHEYKKGKLKSGSGDKAKSRKQAIAIGISEAREKGMKTPVKKKKAAKKSTTRKSAAKKKTGSRATKKTASKKRRTTSKKG